MDEEWLQALPRLTVAVAGAVYVVVFLIALSGGASAEIAFVKAVAAMLCLGLLGKTCLALVEQPNASQQSKSAEQPHRHLDVAIGALPDEVAGDSR